jgi:[acyl-carrier-protein] S-malonyltransferase
VAAGSPLGRVQARGGGHDVAPTFAGSVIEWLVEDGDPVSAGQPLVRLLPDGRE